ncbi:MAG: CoA transferase, partial [Chloroflexi bacterium]|nr:CoA transferase [Chloroflexota bacterium]
TPFGRSGPYKDFKATDLIAFAMGGIMNVSGKPGRQPLCAPYEQAYQLACVQAAFGCLLALWQRHFSGAGRTIEVAIVEVLASEPVLNQIARYSVAATISPRTGGQMGTSPGRLYPCKDGYVFLEALDPHNWRAFWDWMGRPDILGGEIWEDRFFRLANIDLIDPLVEAMCREKTREELYRQGQDRHLPEAAVRTPEEYLAAEHTAARQSFVELDHPALGRLPHALPPFRFSACSCGPAAGPPALGQDTAQILGELDGSGPPARAGAAPVLPGTRDEGLETGNWRLETGDRLPLAGVRVLAFTTQVAGPTLARILADYGADVTTVETSRRPRWPASVKDLDPRTRMERTLMFQENHRNQRSITLDLGNEEGRALARQLVRVSDVVMENFSLGVLERWGCDYESLCAIRPDLILVSMQGMGRTGPDRYHTAAGYTLMALTGMTYLWSYADTAEPAGTRVAYPDFLGAAQGAVAVMAALHHRWRTGQGQHIDLAQLEAVASVLGPAYLERAAGAPPRPLGNSSRQWSPHGCYPCLGSDRWCVIAVTSQAEWYSLCEAACHPKWIEDERFETNEARLANRDALDSLIAEWTRQYTPHQVMYILQRAGVPAAPVMNSEDLFLDPHFRRRGFIVETDHDEVGTMAHLAPPMLLDGVRPRIRWACPAMGRDNDWTFGDLLGLELERLGAGAR